MATAASPVDILTEIRRTIDVERRALELLASKAGDTAVAAVELLAACRGRVLVTGIGKTGLIGRKIAATLASLGTPAFFLHPAEAYHGDLGSVTFEDLVVAVSNSGETEELVRLIPHLRQFEVKTIALTGKPASSLAKSCDIVIDVGVDAEADELGVAPTASTTALLAMGDALAMALVRKRGFTKEQFGMLHPGGSLGRKLLLLVKDLMHTGELVPRVLHGSDLRTTICEMSRKRLGAAFVVNDSGRLDGLFTDGDLRRLLERDGNPLLVTVDEVMTRSPKATTPDTLAARAVQLMEAHAITVLPVVDDNLQLVGAIHLHDLVKAGVA